MTDAGPLSDSRLSRATAGMAAATLLSRVTGFGRVIALAYALGFTRLTDTYNLANTLPNIVYDLVLGGILSSFIVPVFVDQLSTRDEDEAWDGISAIVTAAVVVLVAMSAFVAVAAPALIRVYTLGVHRQVASDQQAVATALLRLFSLQVLFYGLSALAGGLLNARRRFVAPMATPVLNNVLVIAILLWLPHLHRSLNLSSVRHDHLVLGLIGIGTTAGVALQVIALWPAVRRAGLHLHLVFRWHPALARAVRLSGWTFGYVVTNQISLAVAFWLANHGKGGDLSAFQAAYLFFQLPYGVLAISILTALTPDLAERWSRGDEDGYRDRFGLALRLVTVSMLPAAAGYALVARPLVTLFLHHGATGLAATHLTADLLVLFAVGLPAFSAYLLVVRGFTSMQDTRTPFVINAGENAVTVVLYLAFYALFGVRGLAAAFSIGYVVALVGGAWWLRRRAGGLGGRAVVATAGRALGATAVMAAVVAIVLVLIRGDGTLVALRVVASVGLGVTVYVIAAKVLRIDELTRLLQVRAR